MGFTLRRRLRHLAAATTAIALTMTGLAACSSSSGPADNPSASGPTTISWWSWNPDDTSAPAWIKSFEAAHPDIKVDHRFIQYSDYVNAVRLAATSNSGPDVFGLQVGALTTQFAPVTTDLAPLAEKAIGPDWKDKLLQTEQLQVDGRQVGLPWMITGGGLLWYNKTLLDKVGAQPPTTLQEWKTACAKVEAAGTTCFVQGAKDDWQNIDVYQSIINQLSPGSFYTAVKGETPFDNPDSVRAFDVWKSLFDEGIVQKGALGMTVYPDANDEFNKGKAAMIALGTWQDSNMTKTSLKTSAETYGDQITKQVFLPVPFPDVVGGAQETGRLFGGPDVGWAISAKSEKKDAAFTLVQWLTSSEEAQKQMAMSTQTPALKSVPVDDSDLVNPDLMKPVLAEQASQINNLVGPRQIPNADVQTALGQALSSVASGQMTSAEASASVQQAIDAAK